VLGETCFARYEYSTECAVKVKVRPQPEVGPKFCKGCPNFYGPSLPQFAVDLLPDLSLRRAWKHHC